MTFQEFVARQFPEKSVFDRPQFDFVTNLVKWFALRIGYVLFRIGLTANALDVIGIFLSLFGFALLTRAIQGERVFPLVGVLLIYFHVFIDFIDGTIAKARGTSSRLGHHLDSLGCDVDRVAMILLLGLYSRNMILVVANIFSACIFFFFLPIARGEFSPEGVVGRLAKINFHRFSILSVRFMLVLLPFFLGLVILLGWNLKILATSFSLFYISVAGGWLLLCITQNEDQTASAKAKEAHHAD